LVESLVNEIVHTNDIMLFNDRKARLDALGDKGDL